MQQQASSVYFYNVRDAVHNFVGREDILNQIHDSFVQGEKLIEVIGGLGGMGKTQAALKYIKKYKTEYCHRVRWITAESESALNLSYRKFAQDLGLCIEKKSNGEIIDLVKKKLEYEIKQSLLIFDNVEDRDLIRNRYLPNLGGKNEHHILITTRNTKDYEKHASRSRENIVKLKPFSALDIKYELLKQVALDNLIEDDYQEKLQKINFAINIEDTHYDLCISLIRNTNEDDNKLSYNCYSKENDVIDHIITDGAKLIGLYNLYAE